MLKIIILFSCIFYSIAEMAIDKNSVSNQYINATRGCGYFIAISGNNYAFSGITEDLAKYGLILTQNRISKIRMGNGVVGCHGNVVNYSVYMNGDCDVPVMYIVDKHLCDFRWTDTAVFWITLCILTVLASVAGGIGVVFFLIQHCRKRNAYQPIN
jgi:hypothetical protein